MGKKKPPEDKGQLHLGWNAPDARMMLPSSNGSLEEASEVVRANMSKGVICPCCRLLAKIWPDSFRWNMAAALQALVRAWVKEGRPNPPSWVHLKTFLAELPIDPKKRKKICEGTFPAGLAKWGLLEKHVKVNRQKGEPPNTGKWRLTTKGILFAAGKISVPRMVFSYGKKVVGFEGPMLDIHKALKTHFSCDEALAYEVPDGLNLPI